MPRYIKNIKAEINPIFVILILLLGIGLILVFTRPHISQIKIINSTLTAEIKDDNFMVSTGNSSVYFAIPIPNSRFSQKKNTYIYKNKKSNNSIQINYQQINKGLKEEVLLKNKFNNNNVNADLWLNDLIAIKNKDGIIIFYDHKGNYKFHISKPFAVDAKGDITNDVSYDIQPKFSPSQPNRYSITYAIDSSWYSQPNRNFPITLSYNITQNAAEIKDTLATNPFNSNLLGQPTLYKDNNNQWQDIDTTIKNNDTSDYSYINKSNVFQTYFSNKIQDNIKFQKDDAWITFKAVSRLVVKNIDSKGQEIVDFDGNINTSDIQFQSVIGGNHSIFSDLQPNQFKLSNIYQNNSKFIDLIYSVSNDKLSEEMFLSQYLGFPELTQEMHLQNVYVKIENNKVNFYHPSNNRLLWHISPPRMYEKNNPQNINSDIQLDVQCKSKNTNLDNCSDLIITKVIGQNGKNWLSDPKRQYPIMIDPNIQIDNTDTSANWVSNNSNLVVSQDTVNKTEGTGSVKLTANNTNMVCWATSGACDTKCTKNTVMTTSVYPSCSTSSCPYGGNSYTVSGSPSTLYAISGNACEPAGTGNCYQVNAGVGSSGFTSNNICMANATTCGGNTFYYSSAPACNFLDATVKITKAATDLSQNNTLTFWVNSSVAGAFMRFEMGINSEAEQSINFIINNPNTWEQKTWDLSTIPAASRTGLRYFAFKVISKPVSTFTFNFDDIRSWTAYPLNMCSVTRPMNAAAPLTVFWNLPTGTVYQFDVQRSVNSGAFSSITTTSGTATSFPDNTTTNGNTYQYQVAGEDASGLSLTNWCVTAPNSINLGDLKFNGVKTGGVKYD